MELIFKILKHFMFLKKISQLVLIQLIKQSYLRKKINVFYNRMNFKEKKQFYSLFSEMFQNDSLGINGEWHVDFLDTTIWFNLSKENSWLEWNTALSILGHDIEIKETYEYLIKNGYIKCFFDIGANYGTHSLLFLSQNIQTITFEPNTNCHKYFYNLLQNNNLKCQMESFALGDKESIAKLMFPDKKTWLGKIQTVGNIVPNSNFNQNILDVHITTIDLYLSNKHLIPDLIKIDTEGFEKFVLMGATSTIEKYKPFVIFECNPEERDAIFEIMNKIDYSIYYLPFRSFSSQKITKELFIKCRLNNFIAIHTTKLKL